MASSTSKPRARSTGSKSRAPAWSSLSPAAKRLATARIIRALGLAGKYKIVSPDVPLRETGAVETTSEDGILTPYRRARLLNLARNSARNSSTLNSILKQFDLQAVGTVGGKATFSFPDEPRAVATREAFAAWTRSADFFDGLSFNTFLKIALKTYILGGDMVLLFDDNLVEDSGRLLIYEPDEIGDLPDAALSRAFGPSARQSQGRVYNANGRFIGVTVSRACRGMSPFDPAKCYTLTRDPNASDLDSLWLMPRNVFRVNQGRGISPLAAPLSTIIDLEDLTEYELQSAKKNSQTLAQIVDTSSDSSADPALTSAFEPGTDFSSMSDSELEAAAEEEAELAEKVVTLDKIRGAGVLYEQMPGKHKLELLDTKHPNANMPEFIRWLAGRAAAPFGLGSVYATLKADASYTAFRGEQVMSQPAFEEAQKFLERICDWCLFRWSVWAARRGEIAPLSTADIRDIQWQWPKMREVNQVDEQNAISLKLRNGTGSYREIYGADWAKRLAQIAEEVALCNKLGLVHPQAVTSSGAIVDPSYKPDPQKSNP